MGVQMHCYLMGLLVCFVFVHGMSLQHGANILGRTKFAETSVPASAPRATKNWVIDHLDVDEVMDLVIDYQVQEQQVLQRHSGHNTMSTMDVSSRHKSSNSVGVSASLRSSISKPHKVIQEKEHKVKHVTLPPIPARRFFFTHHKSGTRLASGIGQDLGNVLNEMYTKGGKACGKHGVMLLPNMNVPTFNEINEECGDFKAVHFVREAAALVVSGYLYHSHSHDTIPGTGPQLLAGKSLKDGLLIEAKAEIENTLPEMLHFHNEVQDDPRVLTIGLEETTRDFDGTMRKIFMFMLDDDRNATNYLVDMASRFDITRWPEEERQESDHIADPANAKDAMKTLQELRGQGNELVQKVYSFDAPLGYEEE